MFLLPEISFNRRISFVLLLAVSLAHGLALRNDFVYDDFDLVVHNENLRSPAGLLELKLHKRPVREISLWIDHAIWGFRPAGYHFTNIALHYLCVLLLFQIGLVIAKRKEAALLAALLFAVHPVTTESVAGITHRKEMLAAGFLMGAFLLFLRSPRRIGKSAGAALLYGVGMFAKASAATLPALLFVTQSVQGEMNRKQIARYLPLAVMALFFLGVESGKILNYSGARNPEKAYYLRFNPALEGKRSYTTVLRTSLLAHGRSTRYALWPARLSVEHTYPQTTSVASPAVIGSLISLILTVGLFFVFRRRRPDVAIALFWFVFTQLPTSNLVPITYFFAERYLYLPLAGFCSLAGIAIVEFLHWRPVRNSTTTRQSLRAMIVLILLACAAFSAKRVTQWKDNESLLGSTLKTNPGAPNASVHLARLRSEQGRKREAIQILRGAAARFPNSPAIESNLGRLFWEEGDLEAARRHLERALSLSPGGASTLADLGAVCCQSGDFEAGIRAMKSSVELQPNLPETRYNLGLACMRIGKPEEAAEEFRRALELKPGDLSIALPLGEACLQSGWYTEAQEVFSKVVDEHPDAGVAVWGLARAELALGDTNSCRANLASIRTRPGLPDGVRSRVENLADLLGEHAVDGGDENR